MTPLVACLLAAWPAFSQDPPKQEEPGAKTRLWDAVPLTSSDPVFKTIEFEKEDAPSDGEFFIAPIPAYDPTLGAGLTLAAGYIFPTGADGSPPSMVGGGIYYSDSGSWFTGAGVSLHLDEDRWRLTAGVGVGEVRFEFSVARPTQDEDVDIPLRIGTAGISIEAMRRIVPNFYGGIRVRGGRVRTRLGDADEEGPVLTFLSEQELEVDVVSFSPLFDWDTRNSAFYPTAGTLASFRVEFHPETADLKSEFQVYDLAANQFIPLGADHVLALRGHGRQARGDFVPFFGLSYYGMSADLRGYPVGQYQDRLLLAVQGEWRWRFMERWVATGFAGIGKVAGDFDELEDEHSLPSAGVGLRFTIAPENKLGMRFDIAFTKDDYAYYFGVGEAF